MPEVTKNSEFLSEPEKFTPATKLYPMSVSTAGDNIVFIRQEGRHVKQRITMTREYTGVSQASLRRLHRVLSEQINAGNANIQIDQIAGFTCYEVTF